MTNAWKNIVIILHKLRSESKNEQEKKGPIRMYILKHSSMSKLKPMVKQMTQEWLSRLTYLLTIFFFLFFFYRVTLTVDALTGARL